MITLKKIKKSYTTKQQHQIVLDDINLNINSNEIFGIIGESGAGKTSLLRILLQLEKPDEGQILLNNVDLMTPTHLKLFREQSATVYQDANLLTNKTCYENVYLPLKLRNIKDTGQVEKMLRFVGLEHCKDKHPSTLSGGERQRVSIARALVTQPKILICDEPTSSLDYQSTQSMKILFEQIQLKFGTTMIIVSHDLDFAKSICHRIALLDKSKLSKVYTLDKNLVTEKPLQYKDYVEEILK